MSRLRISVTGSGHHAEGWGSHGERSRLKNHAGDPSEQGWDAHGPDSNGLKADPEDEDEGEFEPGESRDPSWPGHERSQDLPNQSRHALAALLVFFW